MNTRHGSGSRVQQGAYRCAGCGERRPGVPVRHIWRVQHPGWVLLCAACWSDCLAVGRSGAYDLGALLEDLAELGRVYRS